MSRFPAASTAKPLGNAIAAEMAGPPSPPVVDEDPLPAYVLITPAGVILRMRWKFVWET